MVRNGISSFAPSRSTTTSVCLVTHGRSSMCTGPVVWHSLDKAEVPFLCDPMDVLRFSRNNMERGRGGLVPGGSCGSLNHLLVHSHNTAHLPPYVKYRKYPRYHLYTTSQNEEQIARPRHEVSSSSTSLESLLSKGKYLIHMRTL